MNVMGRLHGSGLHTSLVALTALTLGCSSGTGDGKITSPGTGAGTSTGGSGANGGGSAANGGVGAVGPIIDVTVCGNGALDDGEACDDGNKTSGDGCNAVCQLEAEWECPEPGEPCAFAAVCGDGILSSTEACDDGNTTDGDGCAGDCSAVDAGWECRLAGRDCVPLCGDSVVTATETCDDGNRESGDGCSSTCLTEPGFTCTGTTCRASVCGNGIVETGESCDAGDENGLFRGDGLGCSRTCTPEPSCRDGSGATTACATACGDGNIDAGEGCDDGNQFDGDGCSSACAVEEGFTCNGQLKADVGPCSSGTGNCLVLPVTFRDFEPQGKPGGHPDFFWMGATGNTTDGSKTTCVTNASGATAPNWQVGGQCLDTDAVDNCTGLLDSTLGADGKPRLNPTSNLTCNCRFTDWDQTGVLQGDPATTKCSVQGDGSQRDRIRKDVRTIKDADSFNDWFNDTSASEKFVTTLELPQVGTSPQYRFNSSDGRTVYDDLHAIFLGTQTTLTSGFFPLESLSGAKYCNLWPYWMIGDTEACETGGSVATQWDPLGSFDINNQNGNGGPIPGSGTSTTKVIGLERNFYFTSEARYLFRFAGGEQLVFDGDDDFWVYVNGRLVLDFGSPHERLRATMTLAADGSASWTAEGYDITTGTWSSRASGTVADLAMATGNTYEIAFFHADRHPRESNYQLTLSSFETTQSVCGPTCGDGIRASGEECDDGTMNADDTYGGCTTECRFGPFCGDGVVSGPEECDAGRDNTVPYGQKDGCAPGCTRPHYCGDGIVDSAFGEQCDGGEGGSALCMADCRLAVQ